jgi:hypothetical protein
MRPGIEGQSPSLSRATALANPVADGGGLADSIEVLLETSCISAMTCAANAATVSSMWAPIQ